MSTSDVCDLKRRNLACRTSSMETGHFDLRERSTLLRWGVSWEPIR